MFDKIIMIRGNCMFDHNNSTSWNILELGIYVLFRSSFVLQCLPKTLHHIDKMLRIPILLALTAVAWAQLNIELDDEPLEYTPVITTSQGKLRGRIRHSEETHKVHFYNGIRYGVAKRFEKPVAAPKWNGILDATSVKAACPQSDFPVITGEVHYPANLTNTKVSSEDCLYLNVWTPTHKHSGNLPVMFWIHGGTYKTGTIFSLAYDARHIAALGQVIVVTVNYRLGPFGFLSGDSDQHPGNLGLYDMLLALKWVNNNIAYFGGDPNQITIDGESAGSFAVSIYLNSKETLINFISFSRWVLWCCLL